MLRPLRSVVPSLRRASLSVSFVPTANVYEHEAEIFAQKEAELAVPDPPDMSDIPSLYTDMVNPEDVQDLFMQPNFQDLVVTSLAPNCPISGSPGYKLLSNSEIRDGNLRFARVADQWFHRFNKSIGTLEPLNETDFPLKYLVLVKQNRYKYPVDESVLESPESIANYLENTPSEQESEEMRPLIRLLYAKGTHLNWVYEYLLDHLEEITPDLALQILPIFLSVSSQTPTDLEARFLAGLLSRTPPSTYESLLIAPTEADKWARACATAGEITTARNLLSGLVRRRKAPLLKTFDVFIGSYGRMAQSQEYSREKVYGDLSPLKAVFFHHGITSVLLPFALEVVDNLYDLHNLIKLVHALSADLLGKFSVEIMARLHHIQREQKTSPIILCVQSTNLANLVITGGSLPPAMLPKFQQYLGDAGVQADLGQFLEMGAETTAPLDEEVQEPNVAVTV